VPIPDLKPAENVRVVQTIPTRDGPWRTEITGSVVALEAAPTGSWFVNGKFDKLWLRRLRLRKPDGEMVDLIVDPDTEITKV